MVNENFVALNEQKDKNNSTRLNFGEAREYKGKEYIGSDILRLTLILPISWGMATTISHCPFTKTTRFGLPKVKIDFPLWPNTHRTHT